MMDLGLKNDAKKEKKRAEKATKVKKVRKVAPGKKEKKAVKEGKFHKLQSIQVKVCSLVLAGILISATLVAYTLINYTKDLVIDATYAKMLNVVDSYGMLADNAEAENNNKVVDNAVYKDLFSGLQVEGSESSYCYVINVSGIIMYHPDESKIGGPNKNKVITKVVSELAKGHRPDVYCMEYEENGKQMYASYYITAAKSVIVMCAEGYELMAPIRGLTFSAAVFILVLMVIAYFLSVFVVKRFTKPLKQVTDIIDDTAQLKLKLPDNMDALCSRQDESGVMSRAVKAMSKSIYEVVSHIEVANGSIETNMVRLETSSNQVHTLCTDNSATTEELAASTEEVTNMTNIMAGHMEEMRKQFEEINRETTESNASSEEIAGRAKAMQESTREAIRQTREMYQQIKDKTALALNGLKSVERINELTGAIIEISDQTSLLSLNASIEAARAGEAGRGFAVVATEISNLAHRSLDTVNDINAIIAEVNEAVTNITNSLEETSAFLEHNVLADYDNFNQIGDQYQRDADTFKAGMTNISNEAAILRASIQEVAKAVERIKETIDETAIGINDIAGKTSEVVQATSDNYDLTGDTVNSVNELKEIVEKFTF